MERLWEEVREAFIFGMSLAIVLGTAGIILLGFFGLGYFLCTFVCW